MKKIVLSLVTVLSLFATENNMEKKSLFSQKQQNKTEQKTNLNKNNANKNITEQKIVMLAQKHANYVLSYQEFLKKVSQKKLDYKKPVILFIGTPDCKWTKEEMTDLLGYPPLWNEIKDNFILVYVNLLKDKLPDAFLVSITPTMYFISPIDGKILTDRPVAGYVDRDELVEYLKGLKKAWGIYLKKVKFKTNIETNSKNK